MIQTVFTPSHVDPYTSNMVVIDLSSWLPSNPLGGTNPKRSGDPDDNSESPISSKRPRVVPVSSAIKAQRQYDGVIIYFEKLDGDNKFLKIPRELRYAFEALFSMQETLNTDDPVPTDMFDHSTQALLRRDLQHYIDFCIELQATVSLKGYEPEKECQDTFVRLYADCDSTQRLARFSSILLLSDYLERSMSADDVLGLFLGFLNSPKLDLDGYNPQNIDTTQILSLGDINTETVEALFYSVVPNTIASLLEKNVPNFTESLYRTTFESPARGWGKLMLTVTPDITYYQNARHVNNRELLAKSGISYKRMFIYSTLCEIMPDLALKTSPVLELFTTGSKDHDTRTLHIIVSANCDLHTLKLNSFKVSDVSALGNVPKLALRGLVGVEDVSALGRVTNLTLRDLDDVTNVSALGGVTKLTLDNLRSVTDVSALRDVSKLNLINLPYVRDVSALEKVPKLTLKSLLLLRDVSALRSVTNLTLENLLSVRNVSALGMGRVQKLTLNYLPEVENVSALRSITNLTLHNLPRVRAVSALRSVTNLTLHNLPRVRDVSALRSVTSLTLHNLPRVRDVSALGMGRVQNLTLNYLRNVKDVSALRNVQKLNLENLSGVSDVSALGMGRVQNLTLKNLRNVKNVSALGSVQKLTLGYLAVVEDVSALESVQDLTLYHLPRVRDVSTLGKNGQRSHIDLDSYYSNFGSDSSDFGSDYSDLVSDYTDSESDSSDSGSDSSDSE